MSYCRAGSGGDLYIIHSSTGNCLECYCTKGLNYGSFHTKSRQAMIDHIEEHRKDGDVINDYAITRLKCEIHEKGDFLL